MSNPISNRTRLWLVGGVLALVVLAYLLSYLVGLDRLFSITEADLGLMRGRLEGVGVVLWAWVLEKLGIARADHVAKRDADSEPPDAP